MIRIFLLYILVSVVFTYPLVLSLGKFLPGQPNDAYVYLWNIWNFWNQISSGLNPFYTELVMHPIGANMFFHTYAPLISLISLPFLKNLSLFMGVLIILSIAFAAFSVYLLVFKLTSNKVAAFAGGLVYSVSPIVWSFIQSQHYYFLFSSVFYPLGILFLINYIETNKTKFLYFTALIFWIVLLIDYYSAIMYSLTIVTFFLLNVKLDKDNIIKCITVGLFTILLPFTFIYSLERNFRDFIRYQQPYSSSSSCNTNLKGFITPNVDNPIIGFESEINLDTPSYFLGWGLLIIAVISVIQNLKQKHVKGFLILFCLFLVLSFGTKFKYGDITLLEGIYTPFYYFLKIPVLGSIDCPIRFPIIIQLCLSIFIALFVLSKKNKLKTLAAILFLVFIEYAVVNKNFSSTSIPKVYNYLYQDKNTKTVLEIPSGITESKSAFGYDWSIQALHSQQMYWQTYHKKPRVGVYMSRLTSDKYNFFRNEPVISQVFNYSSVGGAVPSSEITGDEIKNFIKKFNLGFIILSPNSRQLMFSSFIEAHFKNHVLDKQIVDGFIYYKIE